MSITRPQTFPGTEAERAANVASHWFDPEAGRCMDCDCRPWGRVAEWPCGTRDIPTESTEDPAGADYMLIGAAAAAVVAD